MTDEEDYIASVIKAREESVSFFSSGRKPERERWVVTAFLVNLGIDPPESAVVSVVDEPPDVAYLDTRFEIKEIMDEGKRRHAEYKESLRQARKATKASDLLEGYTPKDITYTEICQLVEKAVLELRPYAPATKRTLDLLFYVNLEDVHGYVASELPSADQFTHLGWRTISFLAGPMSVVLFAAPEAPPLLRSLQGKVTRKTRGEI